MVLAGYKTISILLLIVLVALAGGSPVFAQPESITFDPPAACPGATVTIFANIPIPGDVVGGRISVAAMSPLDAFTAVLSSDPSGLITNQHCTVQDTPVTCTFQVGESAKCGAYTVTVTLVVDTSNPSVSGIFNVGGTCCPAVGGCVQPVNTFGLTAPWLAVIGLVGCIGTAVVVAKKR